MNNPDNNTTMEETATAIVSATNEEEARQALQTARKLIHQQLNKPSLSTEETQAQFTPS